MVPTCGRWYAIRKAACTRELTAQQMRDHERRTFAHGIRTAVPDHADPAWPAPATALTGAEARGHSSHQLFKEAVAQRELTTARNLLAC
ncbi:hypothetical protein GCM10010361_75710 [Streptomyces olivaceiscleroticus]|uniref:Integrase n=1 Tax=Streptomyces olivaceiscleroticus TaxID=68245 RepID=A0ABN1BJ26_9ACTN